MIKKLSLHANKQRNLQKTNIYINRTSFYYNKINQTIAMKNNNVTLSNILTATKRNAKNKSVNLTRH